MKKVLLLLVSTVVFTAFTTDNDFFSGEIHYMYSFTDLKGQDITAQIAPYFGKEQLYYIDNKNYKALDEQHNWVQLYNSETNSYYYFNKDKTAQKTDGATATSKKTVITKLDNKEKIAGYDCKTIQIETDNATTIYYYCPTLKTDIKAFAQHNFGEWNKYLEATNGAIALKFIMTDHKNGYVWTSIATKVTKMKMSAKDFEFLAEVKLKN